MQSNAVTAQLAERISLRRLQGATPLTLVLGSDFASAAGAPTAAVVAERVLKRAAGDRPRGSDPVAELRELLAGLAGPERSNLLRRATNVAVPQFVQELAALVRNGTFSTIVTANHDAMLERALSGAGMRLERDFQVIYVGEGFKPERPRAGKPTIVRVTGPVLDGPFDDVRAALAEESLVIGMGDADKPYVIDTLFLGGSDVWWTAPTGLEADLHDTLLRARSEVRVIAGENAEPDRFVGELLFLLVEAPVRNVLGRPVADLERTVVDLRKDTRATDLTTVLASIGGTAPPGDDVDFERELLQARYLRSKQMLRRLDPRIASGDATPLAKRQFEYERGRLEEIEQRLQALECAAEPPIVETLEALRLADPMKADPEAVRYLEVLAGQVDFELNRDHPNQAIVDAAVGAARILAQRVGVEPALVERLQLPGEASGYLR